MSDDDVYINQELLLESVFEANGSIEDITGGTVVFDYWYPGNQTTTPDGSVEGTIDDGPAGEASGIYTVEENIKAGDVRFQAKLTLGGKPYRGKTVTTKILFPGE